MAKNKKIKEGLSYSDMDDLLYNTEWAGVTHPFRGKDIDPELLGESADDKDLSEFFDITLDAHDFGGTGNKVSVLGGQNPFSEALEDEPGYDELLKWIHDHRHNRAHAAMHEDMQELGYYKDFIAQNVDKVSSQILDWLTKDGFTAADDKEDVKKYISDSIRDITNDDTFADWNRLEDLAQAYNYIDKYALEGGHDAFWNKFDNEVENAVLDAFYAKPVSSDNDLSDQEFVEAFGQELVKNNIKPKKCKGKNCKVLEDLNGYDKEDFGLEEDYAELYDEDGQDKYNWDDFDLTWDYLGDDETSPSTEDTAHEIDKLADTFEPETDSTVSMDLDPDNWDWDWDDNVTCGWCDETYPKGDCRKDKQLGYICPQCQQEIASRGEPMDYET